MKHKGNGTDFLDQRNNELMTAYRNAVASMHYIEVPELAKIIANTPCSRFWVSEYRAASVIYRIRRGENVLDSMLPKRREMFEDLYDIFDRIMDENPDMEPFDAVVEAVHTRASQFYLEPYCAIGIVWKMKRGWYDERRKNIKRK